MTENLPASVVQFFSASQQADAEGWAQAFAEDGAFHHLAGTEPLRGRAAIWTFLAGVTPGFQEFRGLTIEGAYAVGTGYAITPAP